MLGVERLMADVRGGMMGRGRAAGGRARSTDTRFGVRRPSVMRPGVAVPVAVPLRVPVRVSGRRVGEVERETVSDSLLGEKRTVLVDQLRVWPGFERTWRLLGEVFCSVFELAVDGGLVRAGVRGLTVIGVRKNSSSEVS